MNQNKWMKIAMTVCAVILLAVVAVVITGGISQIDGYANAEKYTAGDAEITGEVKNLDIHWISGQVTVAYHSGNTVELQEKANKTIGEDQKLRWWLDGDTLRVHYCSPGLRLNWNLTKELTIVLPEGMKLDRAAFHLTSGNLTGADLDTEMLELSLTSGDTNLAGKMKNVEANITSGDVLLSLRSTTEKIRLHSTSGTIRVDAEETDSAEIGSTSGNIEFTANRSDTTEISCTSGTVKVGLKRMNRLKVGTTSGNVTAVLPETPGFKANLHTTSGGIQTNLPLIQNGNQYSCGDESGEVDISTTSGSIRIEKMD